MKEISLSIAELALPVPRKGSIDTFSGCGRAPRAGRIEIHQRVQAERAKDHELCESECPEPQAARSVRAAGPAAPERRAF